MEEAALTDLQEIPFESVFVLQLSDLMLFNWVFKRLLRFLYSRFYLYYLYSNYCCFSWASINYPFAYYKTDLYH